MNWFDLQEYFQDNLITIKGCYNFKLKSICKALYHHKLIDTKWNDDITNGLDCSVDALEQYLDGHDFTEVLKYNEYDCKGMWEIIRLLAK